MHVYQSIDEKRTAELIRATGNADALALLAKRKVKAAAAAAGVELVYHKRWRYQLVDHKGHKRTYTGARTEAKTIDMAESRRIRVREIRDGTRPAPKASDTPREFAATVKEYVEAGKANGGRRGFGWSEQHAKYRTANLEWWRERLNLETLQDIELVSVEKTLRELSKTLHNKTVQGYAESVKAFCLWCVKHGYLDADPLHGLGRRDTTPAVPHRPLTVAEVQGVLAKAPPARRLLYKVALATGFRQKELRSLTVGNLDPFGPALTLPARATKNRQKARQFITAELAGELKEATKGKASDEPLLEMGIKNTVTENFHRDCKHAGIPKRPKDGLTFHSLRVTFIQTIVEAGADVKTCMEAARHGSAAMTFERYAKPNPERLRTLAEATQKALSEIKTGIAVAQREGTTDSAVAQPKENVKACAAEIWLPGQDSNPLNGLSATIAVSEGKTKYAPQIQSDEQEPTNGVACGCEPAGTAENARWHSSGATDSTRNPDLAELASLWDRLPEAVRAGILATARAVAGGKVGDDA